MIKALAIAVLLAGACGCAGTERQAECHGPWTPVNVPQQVRAHG